MSYDDEYFCPNCGATLNDQPGFNPDLGAWTCTICGKTLYGDDVESTMAQFNGVVWYCDSCGAILNKQAGFSDYYSSWRCSECGHENPINEDEIYESKEDYQSRDMSSSFSDYDSNDENEELEDNTDADDDAEGDADDDFHYSYTPSFNAASIKSSSYSDKKRKRKKIKRIITLIVLILTLGTLKYFDIKNAVPFGFSSEKVKGMDYRALEQQLEESGFWSIWPSAVYDLDVSDIELDGTVIEVKVNWKTNFKESSRFPIYSIIGIRYHSLKKIRVPMSAEDAKGKDYREVMSAFEEAGFISIKCEAKPDLITGWITKEFSVDSLTVDGNKDFGSAYSFRPDAEVVITYHTFD